MSTLVYLLLLALIGLATIVALLIGAVQLARAGQPVSAALTGTGAVALAVGGMYRLLLALGQLA